MDTRLVYIDECGDDGNNAESSKYFILTSTYFPIEDFQNLYDTIKEAIRCYLFCEKTDGIFNPHAADDDGGGTRCGGRDGD